MSPMAHNLSTEIFGDDAGAWRPQRWLSAGEQVDGKAVKSERQRRMEKYNVTVSFLSSSPSCSLFLHLMLLLTALKADDT